MGTKAMQRCNLSSHVKTEKIESQSVPQEPEQETEKLASSYRGSKTPTKKRCRISRKRPFKNVRERRRRAEIKTKFVELHNAIASATSQSICGAKRLLIAISENKDADKSTKQKPCKMEILGEAIESLEALNRELTELRARNTALKSVK